MRHRKFTLLMALVLALAIPLRSFAATESNKDRALVRRGTRLWSVYCARCHHATPASAYSPAQWDTIMLHMRSRASLTGEDATAIVKFLQAQ